MRIYRLLGALCVCAVCSTQSAPVSLPQATTKALYTWIETHKTLVNSLLARDIQIIDYAATHKKNLEDLKGAGLINLARSNYIFEIPTIPGYIIKISALPLRAHNILSANGYNAGTIQQLRVCKDAEFKKSVLEQLSDIPTYQTVSSLNTYQLYRTFTDFFTIKHVIFPATFALNLSVQEKLHDKNCIIVQEKIDLVDEKTATELRKKLSPEQLKELVVVIGACGLWNLKTNLQFNKNGNIVIVDLEQPDISNPIKGFNQYDLHQFTANVRTAIEELVQLFDGDLLRQKLIQNYAEPLFD